MHITLKPVLEPPLFANANKKRLRRAYFLDKSWAISTEIQPVSPGWGGSQSTEFFSCPWWIKLENFGCPRWYVMNEIVGLRRAKLRIIIGSEACSKNRNCPNTCIC